MSAPAATTRPLAPWPGLQGEHDRMWELLERLSGGAGSGNEAPAPPQQRQLAKSLVQFASAHELAESLVMWPALARRCGAGDDLLANLLEQERDLRRALNELNSIAAGTEEFAECVDTIAATMRNHLSYEQNQAWPRLVDRLGPEERAHLHRRWQSLRPRLPRRPHPHLAEPALWRAGFALADWTQRRLSATGHG